MVEFEAGTPIRCTQQCLDGAGQIHKTVAHQEEHRQQRGQYIDITCVLMMVAHVKAANRKKRTVNQSYLPNRIPPWQMIRVSTSARVGSPRFEDTANGLKNGMTSSLAMACNRRGAPVKLCNPAPRVDRNEPTNITHSFGHAIFATTNFPPIEAPNL